jgi:hypothetical protein
MPFQELKQKVKKAKEAFKTGTDAAEQSLRNESQQGTRIRTRELFSAIKTGTDAMEDSMRAEKGEVPGSARAEADRVTQELAQQRLEEEVSDFI